MSGEYRLSRTLVITFYTFALTITFFVSREPVSMEMLFRLFLAIFFLYCIAVISSSRVILTDDSIKNVLYFTPFHKIERECKFANIDTIKYDFAAFQEDGVLKILPKPFSKTNIVVVSFLINNKKEIINILLKKAPHVKIPTELQEKFLSYKLISLKFLLV